MSSTSITTGGTSKQSKLDPKRVAELQAKITRLVDTGALNAAPHTYHH